MLSNSQNGSRQMLTADELYRHAGIEPTGTTPWGDKVRSTASGVYVISLDLAPSATQLLPLASEIERSRWKENKQAIVYIGRSINIGKRLDQFRRHKYGARSPHRGGQAILLLDCPKTVRWAVIENYRGAEDLLIKAFVAHVGKWPFGNRTSSAQTKAQGPS